jgi:hypothetical protein
LPRLSVPVGRKIRKACKAVVEKQIDLVGRAVTVFFHEQLGATVRTFAFFEPFCMVGVEGSGSRDFR